MKTLLALLILLGGGGYYLYTVREENAKMRAELARLTELLPEDERAKIHGSKPLSEDWKGMIHKRVICPQCKGEGAVMVRRTLNATITDVKTMCGLCMGAGKREFDMPSKSEVCPDCGGMGKRILFSSVLNTKSGRGLGQSSLDGANGPQSGFSQQAPTSTSCARCLGRGSIDRPGLQ